MNALLMRRRMMMQKKNGRPSLRSNLAGWITTDFLVTENMTLEYEIIDYGLGFYAHMCGTATNMLAVEGLMNSERRVFANIRTSSRYVMYKTNSFDEIAHIKINMATGEVYRDGILKRTFPVEDGIEASVLRLFSAYTNTRTSDIRLFFFNFYEGETLVHSLVPYLDDNNIACIRDDITGKIYYNENSSATKEFLYEEV